MQWPVMVQLFTQNADKGIVALGMTFVIIAAGIDLSVGSLLALSGVLMMLNFNKFVASGTLEGSAVVYASLIALISGLAIGLFNGAVIVWGKIAPFVATLVGLLAFRSLGQALAEGGTINATKSDSLQLIANTGFEHSAIVNRNDVPITFSWPIWIWIALALVFGFLLNRTQFGRHVIAVGSNEKAARYSGIPVQKIKFLTYGLVGLCVGIASVIQVSKLASVASGSTGLFWELDAIAAVVIGGTSLNGGRGRIWGTFVGVLLLGLISTLLVTADVSVYWQGVVKGGIILVAALLQRGK